MKQNLREKNSEQLWSIYGWSIETAKQVRKELDRRDKAEKRDREARHKKTQLISDISRAF